MKILMIGLGGIGQRHLRNLRTLFGNRVKIAAYRVRGIGHVLTDQLQLESNDGLETKYHVSSYSTLEAALSFGPNVAFLCNPSSLHVSLAIELAKAGCHLFIEKPLSNTMDGVDELVSLVETNKLTAMVGYQLRFHPCILDMKRLITNNTIGPILSARVHVGEFLPNWHPYEDYRQMYASRKDLGGGVILSQIHEFDYLYWLFGSPKRLFALGGHLSSLEVDVEDVASVLMEYGSGTHDFPVHLSLDFVQRPPSRGCEVIGDRGKIVLDLRSNKLVMYNDKGEIIDEIVYTLERNELFLAELTHFFECVEHSKEPIVTLRDGAQSLRAALAAKESIQERRVINFET